MNLDRAYRIVLAVESISLFKDYKFKEKDKKRIIAASKIAIRNQTYY